MTATVHTAPSIRPWYREPWPWVLIGLPLTVVIASVVTIVLANRAADSLVTDNYYKQGLAVGGDIQQEQRAQAMHLQGELRLQSGRIEIALNQPVREDTLRLRLRHPLDKQRDLVLDLHRVAPQRYAAFPPPLDAVRWRVHVETAAWRLAGVWKAEGAVTLLPGV